VRAVEIALHSFWDLIMVQTNHHSGKLARPSHIPATHFAEIQLCGSDTLKILLLVSPRPERYNDVVQLS